MNRAERYFRRTDTILAKTLTNISPEKGSAYRNSPQKRVLDVALAVPATAVSVPVVAISAVAVFLEDMENPFYVQQRLTQRMDKFPLVKLRSMRTDADLRRVEYAENIEQHGDNADPRITKVGSILRRLDVNEAPQLAQVITGQMSAIGLRAAAEYVLPIVEKSHPKGFEKWKEAYQGGKPGILSLNSAYNGHRFNNASRVHFDTLYAREASLGLDLLILYKHTEKAVRSIKNTVQKIVGKTISS